MTIQPTKAQKQGLILALLLIGLALRLHGSFWDAPYFFNPDEKRLIDWGMQFNYLNPGVSEWGTLPLLLIKAITESLGLDNRAELYGLARCLAALLGGVIIALTYRLARASYGWTTALYATIFTAFTVLLIQYAHFYNLDSLFTLFVLLSLLAICQVAYKGNAPSPNGKTRRMKILPSPRRWRDSPLPLGEGLGGRAYFQGSHYLWAGLLIGLTITVRLNGVLLIPILLIAHLSYALQIGKENLPRMQIILKALLHPKWWLALSLIVLIFVVLTPAAVLNPGQYLFHDGLVWILLQSQGYLKSQYTLQFEGTSSVFLIFNLLFWAAGPLLLLAYGVGAVFGLFRWRKPENLIILTFVLLYIYTTAGARVKFIRYALPLLPLLNILAAAFFATTLKSLSISKFEGPARPVRLYSARGRTSLLKKFLRSKPLLRRGVIGWLGLTIAGSAVYALAFTRIYSQPDIRIAAAQWLETNLPDGAVVVHENDTVYLPPIGYYEANQNRYRFREINLNTLYETSPLRKNWSLPFYLQALDVEISRRGDAPVSVEPATMSIQEKRAYLQQRLFCADYLLLSERHYAVYRDKAELFPLETEYYRQLFEGRLGFWPVNTFERKPGLAGWTIDDSPAELTFRIFDHPTIWLFQAQLPPEYFEQHPPQIQTQANWANWISLAGYNINKREAQAGETIELTLYWQGLADMDQDYTIFLQLQDNSRRIVAQNDYQVAQGLMPTSCWQPGRIVADITRLAIPADVSAGDYSLKLGLYFFETKERLPLMQDASGENAFTLTKIRMIN